MIDPNDFGGKNNCQKPTGRLRVRDTIGSPRGRVQPLGNRLRMILVVGSPGMMVSHHISPSNR